MIVEAYATTIHGFVLTQGDIYFLDEQGRFHKDDGPAIICKKTLKLWWKHGKKHREDGPAIEYHDGSTEWFYDNLRHRSGGPAVDTPYGKQEWYEHGKLHRLDGPAVINKNSDGTWKEYWVDDVRVYENDTGFWELLNYCPEAILDFYFTSAGQQELALSKRPDLIGKIKNLKPEVLEKYKHELELAGVDV